jgi:hypothetical protein
MKGLDKPDNQKPVVWPEHWDAWRVFMAMATQWNGAGMAGLRVGLRYEALPVASRGVGVKLSPAVFRDIRLMEAEALSAWSEKRGK